MSTLSFQQQRFRRSYQTFASPSRMITSLNTHFANTSGNLGQPQNERLRGGDRADTESAFSATSNNTRMSVDPLISQTNLFGERQRTANSISPEQALINMIKTMLGTGLLSLPLAFKYSGIWLGLFLLICVCFICTFTCRQLVNCSQFFCQRKGREVMDYANVMRSAIECGPPWISERGYFFKQLVNSTMFVCQLGFCCVYFVFMADNVKQFFDETSQIHISQAGWIALLLVPTMALCTIRQLKVLAPLALVANLVYLVAVFIILEYLITHLGNINELPAVGNLSDLPLFFGTVIFAFEGIAVVLPIENQMDEPHHFISPNGVLNTSCLLVLCIYCTMGFYGYLAFGDGVKDTVALNLPSEPFYQIIKIMLVSCILVSYPLQFYVPMERVEKWISRKIDPEKQNFFVYFLRYSLVLTTCLIAELIPHLALFISLVGAFAGTSLALIYPPIIDLLCKYSQNSLTKWIWVQNLSLLTFGLIGFTTGTYSSLVQIDLPNDLIRCVIFRRHDTMNNEHRAKKRGVLSLEDGVIIDAEKPRAKREKKLVIPVLRLSSRAQIARLKKLVDEGTATEADQARLSLLLDSLEDEESEEKIASLPLESSYRQTVPTVAVADDDDPDYASVPVEEFGLAFLRGCGWKDAQSCIGKSNPQAVSLRVSAPRPKGLGLGAVNADPIHAINSTPPVNQGLELKKIPSDS